MNEYLEKTGYKEFLKRVRNAEVEVPNFRPNIEALYNQMREGASFFKKLLSELKNRFGISFLIIFKFLFFWVEKSYYFKKFGIFTIDKLDNDYKLVVVFTFGSDSTYKSQLNILQKFEAKGVKVIAITTKKTFRSKEQALKKFKKVKFIFLDLEIKNLLFKHYLNAKKVSKKEFIKILKNIEDGEVFNILKEHKNFIELNLQKQNLLFEVYNKLFLKIDIKAIISNGFWGGLLRATKVNNIKSIALQHGAISEEKLPGYFREEDELILWGEYWRSIYQDRVSEKTKMISLGCVRFDDIVSWRSRCRDKFFYKKFGLNENKPLIVFFSSSHGGVFSKEFYFKVILDIAFLKEKFSKDINLIVRLHPGRESIDLYEQVLNSKIFDQIVFLSDQVSLYQLLKYSDIAISVSSTALLEAMAFDVPVIQFNPLEELNIMEYSKEGGGILARERVDLFKKVKKIIENNNFRQEIVSKQNEYLKKVIVNIGTATEEIVNYLLRNT